ncbi:hypothetical protein UXP17_03300 [Enterobacter hormaechei]|nr:MAG TPA: hypothetical protein [Caudoviricetes sp.]
MKLFVMEGFLRGKCLPGDMKVNETNAEYLVRKFTDLEQKLAESQREFRDADATIENLQMQVEKLAAENAGIKAAIDATIRWQQSTDPENVESVRMLVDVKTPATEVILADVMAQGVEMLRKHPAIKLCSLTHVCDDFAAQLRKGVQS